MPIIDVIFVIILSGFIFYGLFFGLIRALGVLLGLFAGAWVASHSYLLVFAYIEKIFFSWGNFGKVVVFLFIFSLVQKLVMILVSLLSRLFGFMTIIPFLKSVNRLAGAVLGFFEGSLFIGLLIFVTARYSFINHWFASWLLESVLAPFFLKIANVFLPFLPLFLKQIKSII
jgi:uncharacterized membrane protein required for colicin V production